MQIHYEARSEGVGPWQLRVFWALVNGIMPIGGFMYKSPGVTLTGRIEVSLRGFRAHNVGRSPNWLGGGGGRARGGGRSAVINVVESDSVFTSLSLLPFFRKKLCL